MSEAPVIAAIGNFDGLHLGHRHLIDETIAFARGHGARPGAVFFDPHPRRFFNPDAPAFLLTAPSLRADLLREAGIEEVRALTFDKGLSSQSPEEFVVATLKQRLGLGGVVAGADFRFGNDRAGGIEALQKIGEAAGLAVRIAEVVADRPGAEKYSSTTIREAIANGRMGDAAGLLGRPWAVRGMVAEGQKLGRTLGFATANMILGDVIAPRPGVYATRARAGGRRFDAVSNYGRRPTVGAEAPLLETHLFDFEGDLYGQTMDVAFIEFLRDERKFDGLDALKAQIQADCGEARTILAEFSEKAAKSRP